MILAASVRPFYGSCHTSSQVEIAILFLCEIPVASCVLVGEIIESSAEFLSGSRNALPQPADIKKVLEDFLPARISRGLKEL